MNRKTSILMGAAAALTAAPVLAAPATSPAEPAVPAASSYSDLLQPIPNAVERLKIADMQEDQNAPAGLIKAQYGQPYNNHHHHHHHHDRRWYMSNGYVYWNGAWIIRPAWWGNRRNHHHHHHNSYPPHY
jgi:hypothetical protein